MFFINHTEISDTKTAIIDIEGPLNSETSPDFEDYVKKLIESGFNNLLIDMYKLYFISSEGIGATLLVNKRVKENNGLVVFFNLNGEVSGLFDILGFTKIFGIAGTESEAIQMLDDKKKSGDDNLIQKPIREDAIIQEKAPSHQKVSAIELDIEGKKSSNKKVEAVFTENSIFEPFVIECLKCGSLIRIKEKGDHICPFCDVEFSVVEAGKAIFKIDEITS